MTPRQLLGCVTVGALLLAAIILGVWTVLL